MSMNNFEAELSRFESEISNVGLNNGPVRMPLMPSVPPPNGMFPPMMPGIPPLPPPPPNAMTQLMNNNPNPAAPPARLPPRPAFLPPQLRQRLPHQSMPYSARTPSMGSRLPAPPGSGPVMPNSVAPPPSLPLPPPPTQTQPVLSAQPMLYKNQATQDKPTVAPTEPSTAAAAALPRPSTAPTIEAKSTVPKPDKPTSAAKTDEAPHPVSKAYAQANESKDHDMEEGSSSKKKNKTKTPKKARHVRMAGGTSWEDETLGEWDADDFRLFCGDLGNEVTDDVLTRAFNKYPSFIKARVVRDKRSGKTRGYGFVSFKDSQDYIRAMREMNGKYVGNRPIKLRKSTWKDRSIDIVKKKMKEKMRMGLR